MDTLLQSISEDRQALVGRLNADENSLHIPEDLIFEILLRLSTKSIARCRCVSKLWSSILDRQDFTDHYLKRSSSRPQLLFAVVKDREVSFFSAPQNQEDDNYSSTITASYRMSITVTCVWEIYSPISGLVCVRDKKVWVICNPSTGQSFTLPIRKKKSDVMRSFFGYDPVGKQFKVLSMTVARNIIGYPNSTKHQVLTLQAGQLSWRMIECGVPHHPLSASICINGILYYKAVHNGGVIVISFDVRSEKFSYIEVMGPFVHDVFQPTVLINLNGKLASIMPSDTYYYSRETTGLILWVLDDIEKKEWSQHFYKLPRSWKTLVAGAIDCVRVTASNEVVFSEYYLQNSPFYVFYYSLERETLRRVEIQGMEALKNYPVVTFVDHVEDVKLIKGVSGVALK